MFQRLDKAVTVEVSFLLKCQPYTYSQTCSVSVCVGDCECECDYGVQGRTFWERFVKVFRSYILRYSLLGDLTCDASQLQTTLDFAFTVITTNFVKGT